MTAFFCVSIDLDGLACYTAIHGLGDGPTAQSDPIFNKGLPRFLELLDQENISATLFVIGRDLESKAYAKLLKEASRDHELANHTENHFYDLRSRSLSVIKNEIALAEARLEELCGQRPRGFRTPGYNLSPEIIAEVSRRGYTYDASIFPCPPYYAAKGAVMAGMRLAGRRSHSQMNLPQVLSAPLSPYRVERQRPWRRGKDIWEVPMAVVPGLRFPLIGTSLHSMPRALEKGFLAAASHAVGPIFSLEFHGIDMLDASDLPKHGLLAKQPDLHVPLGDKIKRYKRVFDTLRRQRRSATLADAVASLC